MAEKAAARKTTRSGRQNELIKTGTDKRFVRRTSTGQFKDSDDVGNHSSQIDGPRQPRSRVATVIKGTQRDARRPDSSIDRLRES